MIFFKNLFKTLLERGFGALTKSGESGGDGEVSLVDLVKTMVDDLVDDGDFIEVIINKLNAPDDHIIRCSLKTIIGSLCLVALKMGGTTPRYFQDRT